MQIVLLIVAVGVGVLIAIQPALNTHLARSLGHAYYGALANFSVGFVAVAAIGLVIIRPSIPKLADVTALPWWAFCGGLLGASFVTMAILLLPKLGVVLMIAAFMVGQLMAASIIDQFGLLGVRQLDITPMRAVGLLVLLLGLVLVQIGTPKKVPAQTEVAVAAGSERLPP